LKRGSLSVPVASRATVVTPRARSQATRIGIIAICYAIERNAHNALSWPQNAIFFSVFDSILNA
jgi:hypothetical protein